MVDIDGDGRKDTVRLDQTGFTSAVVSVTNAKGTTAALAVTLSDDPSQIADAWYATAKLDGAKGSEVLLMTFAGDGAGFAVLTWKNGDLVVEEAPRTPEGSGWYLLGYGYGGAGFHFFTASKRRYVDAGSWTCSADKGRVCTATVIRSVWRSGAWHKVKRFARRKLTWAQIDRYTDFTGVKLTHR